MLSQSPDEDSLSSDSHKPSARRVRRRRSLNPLTRIHCLPTSLRAAGERLVLAAPSQSPDEDSLSSDAFIGRFATISVFQANVSIP